MPGMPGTEVLRRARPEAPQTLFIIMTAYGTLESAIIGIRQGAFDYLLKPSPAHEIVRVVETALDQLAAARQEAHPIHLLEQALANLREEQGPPASASGSMSPPMSPSLSADPSQERFLTVADLVVDRARALVLVQNKPVELTPTEFEILTYLMDKRDRIVSASDLAQHLRGYELDERDARVLLRAHIHRLRQKIEPEPSKPRYVVTVHGRGFRFFPGLA